MEMELLLKIEFSLYSSYNKKEFQGTTKQEPDHKKFQWLTIPKISWCLWHCSKTCTTNQLDMPKFSTKLPLQHPHQPKKKRNQSQNHINCKAFKSPDLHNCISISITPLQKVPQRQIDPNFPLRKASDYTIFYILTYIEK